MGGVAVPTQPVPPSSGADLLGFDTGLSWWVAFPLFILLWGVLTYILIKLLNRHFRGMAAATGHKTIDLVVSSQQGTLVFLFTLLGAKIVLDSRVLENLRPYSNFTLVTLVVLTTVIAAIRVATTILTEMATVKVSFRPLVGPTSFVIKLFVIVLGVILWMEALQIPITSIVMALGIGGVAAGLALQDTLANLFAGIWILVHRHIRVGDYIKMSTGEEGFVESIGWRNTNVLTRQNNLLVVPNRRLGETSVTNFSLPHGQTVTDIEVPVGANESPERIHRILREESKVVPGVMTDKEPLIRLIRMDPSGLLYRLTVAVESALDRETIESELRERILLRLRKEGVAPWSNAESDVVDRKATRRRTR